MCRSVKNLIQFIFVSWTAFLVGCSGCVSKAGDSVSGTGVGILSPNGQVYGTGTGIVTSQSNGTKTGAITNQAAVITMSNPTDNIVCTSSSGIVTVYTPGQWKVGVNLSTTSTCVDTPANISPITNSNAATKMKNSF